MIIRKYIFFFGFFIALALSTINSRIALGCVVVGCFILAGIQLSSLGSSGKWMLIGGKPLQKIEGPRKAVSLLAIGLLLGVLTWLLLSVLWLRHVS